MTAEQLKAELIRIVQHRNKDYGIVVRRIASVQLMASLLRSRVIMGGSGNAPGPALFECNRSWRPTKSSRMATRNQSAI